MPKDEFDFEDPFELNGMAFLTHEDTTNDMAETFIEEFMRMGYGHKQILGLFRNPHYLGPNLAFEKRGEPFIHDLITEVFARWGKVVTWPDAGRAGSPLPAAELELSSTESERRARSDAPYLEPFGQQALDTAPGVLVSDPARFWRKLNFYTAAQKVPTHNLALTRPAGTLSHRMGEGWGEGEPL